MSLETVSIYAAFAGIALIFVSGVASLAAALTQGDLSLLTSVLNGAGFGLMSFGAGGILYVATYGG